VFSITGCTSPPTSLQTAKDRMVAIAIKEAQKSWGNSRVEVESVQVVNERYVVTLWRHPIMPGGWAVFELSEDGELIASHAGR
jgi:hypothetical protein